MRRPWNPERYVYAEVNTNNGFIPQFENITYLFLVQGD